SAKLFDSCSYTSSFISSFLPLIILRHLLFFIFFFYPSGDHRHLHSFPTRRSSDLPSKPALEWPLRRSLSWVSRLPRDSNAGDGRDRKSTRLNSSHVKISYAVFCLKKKSTYFSYFMSAYPKHIIPSTRTIMIGNRCH